MKNCLTIGIIALIITAFLSCKKDANAGITGNWHLVSDSTYSSGIGPNGTPAGATYLGLATDNYDFMANGHFIAHIAGNVDSATYNVQAGNKLTINYSEVHAGGGAIIKGAVSNFDISQKTANTLILSNDGLTPGGRFARIITLRK